MILKGKELDAMIDKFDASAMKNWNTFQATGMVRYENAWRNAEDLADTLRIAKNSVDDHAELVHYRGQIVQLAHQARRCLKEMDNPDACRKVLASLVAVAEMDGLIGRE